MWYFPPLGKKCMLILSILLLGRAPQSLTLSSFLFTLFYEKYSYFPTSFLAISKEDIPSWVAKHLCQPTSSLDKNWEPISFYISSLNIYFLLMHTYRLCWSLNISCFHLILCAKTYRILYEICLDFINYILQNLGSSGFH